MQEFYEWLQGENCPENLEFKSELNLSFLMGSEVEFMEERAITIIKNCTMLACEYHIKNRCNKEYFPKGKRF